MRGTLPPLISALLLSFPCCASFPQDLELASMLQFEEGVEGGMPCGWSI
ncbi:MAG: hypothetical protein WAO20_06000 [Acidobacteriota bacterium]